MELIAFKREKCVGCDNYREHGCFRYAYPEVQWSRVGGCAMKTHNKMVSVDNFKLNPLKASKRGREVKK